MCWAFEGEGSYGALLMLVCLHWWDGSWITCWMFDVWSGFGWPIDRSIDAMYVRLLVELTSVGFGCLTLTLEWGWSSPVLAEGPTLSSSESSRAD